MSGLAELVPLLRDAAAQAPLRKLRGRVERVLGATIEARIGGVRVGELCRLSDPAGAVVLAEVVGVTGNRAQLTPIGDVSGLSARAEVDALGQGLSLVAGEGLLGRVLDGLGRPLDDPSVPIEGAAIPIDGPPVAPLARPLVQHALPLGTRAIDSLLTCAEGQRIGVFGGPGAGKSTLMARIVRGAQADVFVVALIGERNREVREFLDRSLTPEARARAVVVAATSDRPALERVKAASVATAIAEWFRERGNRVVLILDSVTRLARGWREIGLAAGEPQTRRGYPPSVFAALPRLLERASSSPRGTITGFFTVLVEGEDTAADPIAEEVKSILDGHIVLSAELAKAEHHPAIDILASRSRVMDAVIDPVHRESATRVRRLLARHADVELLVRVGEYKTGSDPLADEAIGKIEEINAFLREAADEATPWEETLFRLQELAA